VAEGFANFSLVSNWDAAMKRLTLVITFALVTLCQGQAQENRGTACKRGDYGFLAAAKRTFSLLEARSTPASASTDPHRITVMVKLRSIPAAGWQDERIAAPALLGRGMARLRGL
jgi:hypothetical protein